MTPAITLNLVVLRAADLERAERFYTALGLQFQRERHGSGPEHLTSQLGSVLLEIYPGAEGETTRAVRIGLVVPSADKAVTAAAAHGGQVVTAAKMSPWGRRAVVCDPEGHRVELVEDDRAALPRPEGRG
jgi:predicted enzyme related to lactoylglutathione lyase